LKLPSFIVKMGGFVTSPRAYFSIVVHERRDPLEPLAYVASFALAKWGLRGALTAGLIGSLLSGFTAPPFAVSGLRWLGGVVAYGTMLIGLLAELLTWAVWSVLAHAVSRALGGGGEFTHSLSALGYSWVADSAVVACLLIAVASPAAFMLALLGSFISLAWKVVVAGIGLSEAHGVSLSRGLVASAAPCLILGLLLLAVLAWWASW